MHSLLALLALPPLLGQGPARVAPSPFDEVHVLELTADSPALIDGRGPTAGVELEVAFSGTLHLWTRSELDLSLRVVDPADGRVLAEDDDSGGGDVPYVSLDAGEGDHLAVLITSPSAEALGPLELHVVAAPETAATLEAARVAGEGLAEARRLQQQGDLGALRLLLDELVSDVLSPPGSERSERVAEACWQLGDVAWKTSDLDSARAAWSTTRNHRERTLPADHPDLLAARANLANTMWHQGDLAGARALEEAVLAACERTLPEDHPDLLRARQSLAVTMKAQGDLAGARALEEAVLVGYERTLPADHPDLLRARGNLAVSMSQMGDLAGARALREAVLAGFERTLPADHPDLLMARANLAVSMSRMGDQAGARALREAVLEARERTLPADHPDLLAARYNLAVSMAQMGDLPGARALLEAVLAGYERTLPEEHPDLLRARLSLAATMSQMGDLAGARALEEAVLEARERALPADHPDLLRARLNLAATMRVMGDQAGARALFEAVLEARERTLPADHPDLLRARANLAASLWQMGDVAGARALFEAVLEARERTLPADHPDLLDARASLAGSMWRMGDLAGARALQEAVVAGYERTLPADHPDLLAARHNLAVSMSQMGDQAGARALREAVLAGFERTLPADHPDLLRARANLADSMSQMGDQAGARALFEAVLEARERTLHDDHPDLLMARANLAVSMSRMGDQAGARALEEAVLEARERTLPDDHPDLLDARASLAVSMSQMGDLAGARALLPPLCDGMRARVLASIALAPRQARQTVAAEGHRLGAVRFWSDSAGPELQASAFELLETMRLVAGEAARSLARAGADPELAPILEEAASVRRAQGDLIAGARGGDRDAESIAAELTRLSLERDRLEREASRRLAERGVVTRPVETRALRAALGNGEAVVGYRRLAHWYDEETSGRIRVGPDHLLAHVLRADGTLTRVDLGPAAELEELVAAWRAALGAPLLRGFVKEDVQGDAEVDAGARLRERILDPVFAAAGDGVGRLFVCADDLVFLVPLEALPLDVGDGDGDARVGDRVRLVSEVSFARLLAAQPPVESEPSLLALGGVDYDAAGAAPEGIVAAAPPVEDGEGGEAPAVDPSATRGGGGTRSAMAERFQKLLQSRYEAEATAGLFEEAFEVEPALLTRERTTKAALFEAAAGKRFVHLATHGWFAPETVKSTEDAQAGSPRSGDLATMTAEERVTGFAPMTLCGLALAGANGGRDSLGRVPGILTAEELCSLDLSACELAVLSACETNVGIRRAGQGIQSLQAALYAAGARSSITSLWKVDDAATRRLFELFYTKLWEEELPKAEALWQAKRALRAEGAPVRDWAAWVLTGDPI